MLESLKNAYEDFIDKRLVNLLDKGIFSYLASRCYTMLPSTQSCKKVSCACTKAAADSEIFSFVLFVAQ